MSAERGWIADPPPPPPRDAVPGEERKWHIMMGATLLNVVAAIGQGKRRKRTDAMPKRALGGPRNTSLNEC